uniref:Transposase n=1 Tax=Glyptapanteles indiensis TaxID=92994 RepID=B8R3B1_GLYIN|nr:transposase [Glyptapanteles indiensis]
MEEDYLHYVDPIDNCDYASDGDLQILLQAAYDKIRDLQDKVKEMSNKNHSLQRQLRNEKGKNEEFRKNLSQFLSADQIVRLNHNNTKFRRKWTENTIKSSLQIRMVTGCKGYEYLRCNAGYPLPSLRTLRRRIEKFSFAPGLENDIIPWLAKKVETLEGYSRNCYISIDEMQMSSKIEYDKGLKRMVGFISPEIASSDNDLTKPASKVLAIVVKGLCKRWKQVIGTLLTGPSVNSDKQWQCIKNLIQQLEEIGLDVRGVSSDMGPNNVGMWSLLGIHATRGAKVSCSISHPVNPAKNLYFSPDVAHILKNLWSSLVNQDFYIPENIKIKHGFMTNVISSRYVKKLVELQDKSENRGITLSFKLTEDHVNPTGFTKMRVHYAAEFFSRRTAKALRLCALSADFPEIDNNALPTAWFIELVNDWFDIMNSRTGGIEKDQRGLGKIKQLTEFMDIMKKLTFQKGGWKPVQTGILLATTTVVSLHRDLVIDGKMSYLLTARLTTDSVENLFSQIRGCGGGDTNPGPVQVRNIIRLISISQYLHTPKNTNYDVDDSQYFIDFFQPPKTKFKNIINDDDNDDGVDDNDNNDDNEEEIINYLNSPEFTKIQELGLCYIAGWAAYKVNLKCKSCGSQVTSDDPITNGIPHQWIETYSRGGLSYPSRVAFSIISLAEKFICSLSLKDIMRQKNCEEWLLNSILKIVNNQAIEKITTTCDHNTLELLLKQFLKLRIHVVAEEINKEVTNTPDAIQQLKQGVYASPTVYMKNSANNFGKNR